MYPTQQNQIRNEIRVALDSIQGMLDLVPKDRTVSLLIRHAEREPIDNPEMAFIAGLTVKGIRDSCTFGGHLFGKFQPGSIYSSPVGRCIQTAEGIILGASWQKRVLIDDRLTHQFIRVALDAMSISRQSLGVPDQVIELFSLLCGAKGEIVKDRLNIFVTHDTVVMTMLGYLLSLPNNQIQPPGFLDGFFIWQDRNYYRMLWQGQLFNFQISQVLDL